MKYKIIGISGNSPFEISKDTIDLCIKQHCSTGNIQFTEYLLDESQNICGLKGRADLGHGYGFENGWKEFTIKFGETYSFMHEYTSIDAHSDWSDESFKVTLQLVKTE